MRLFVLIPLIIAVPICAFAEPKCVTSEGEAAIAGNDVPSARAEAVSRAKWAALEQAVGVEVKAETVVQNFSLVDDAVLKGIKGVIQDYKLIEENIDAGICRVRARVCVEPQRAESAVMALSLNNALVVFLPAKDPETGDYEESNPLSEAMIAELTKHGYQVLDAAPGDAVDSAMVDKAMKTGNFILLKSLLSKYLANVMLIGKIDYSISTQKGEDIGYGLSMPMNNVTVRLNYRLITRDKTGKSIVLHSSTEEAKGMAMSVKDAQDKGVKALREKVVPQVLDAMARHIKTNTKKVSLTVKGIGDLNANFAAKEAIQNTAWVTSVEEKGLGEFMVGYPENIVYLLNSLGQRGFKLQSFTDHSAVLEYGL